MPEADRVILHANSIAHAGHAVLITGASGSGKSSLSLALMALDCALIADDRTILTVEDGRLIASCPATIAGLIEARGIGILNATPHPPAPVALCIDMDQTETERLPPRRCVTFLGIAVPLILHSAHRHFEASVVHYIRMGRNA